MTRSPFPGMDPYLEQSWRDVHHKLCTYACDDIQAQLGGGLIARVDERLVVELSEDQARSIYPDVRIVQRLGLPGSAVPSAGVALAEPVIVEVAADDMYEGFIQIFDQRGGRVITVVEFLSLSNKIPGHGQEQYRKKQRELQQAAVSLVEVNLLRAGTPATQVPPWRVPAASRTPYHAVVHRGWAGTSHEVYPMPLRDRLPAIRVPLRETDADVVLDVQSLIDRVYRNGAYHVEVDYAQPPRPPLEPDDAAWADDLLRAAGKR